MKDRNAKNLLSKKMKMKLRKECCVVTTSVSLKEGRCFHGGRHPAVHAQGIVPLPGVKEEPEDVKIGNRCHGVFLPKNKTML